MSQRNNGNVKGVEEVWLSQLQRSSFRKWNVWSLHLFWPVQSMTKISYFWQLNSHWGYLSAETSRLHSKDPHTAGHPGWNRALQTCCISIYLSWQALTSSFKMLNSLSTHISKPCSMKCLWIKTSAFTNVLTSFSFSSWLHFWSLWPFPYKKKVQLSIDMMTSGGRTAL